MGTGVRIAAAALALLAGTWTMTGSTQADALKVGDPAPDVALALDDGTTFRLKDAKGPVVLYFYPKDDTPGCTREACAYRDRNADVVATGATVIGISFDDAASHKKFKEKYSLPFRLATDDGSIAKAFGVAMQEYGGASYHTRDTVVIGADGKVLAIIRKADPVKSVDQVLEALAKAKKKR